MSACDTCAAPGRCCSGFTLNLRDQERMSAVETMAHIAAHSLPFLPLYRVPAKHRGPYDGGWRFWCPLLGRDGRCTDYENRPETCRDFEPLSDPLCFHFAKTDDAAATKAV